MSHAGASLSHFKLTTLHGWHDLEVGLVTPLPMRSMDGLFTYMDGENGQIQWEMYVNIPLHGSYGLNPSKH